MGTRNTRSGRKPAKAPRGRAPGKAQSPPKPELPPVKNSPMSKRYLRRAAIKREKPGAWHRNVRGFCLALRAAMRRHGDDVATLHAAVASNGEITIKHLREWVRGSMAPRYRRTLALLAKIEDRYGLDRDYLTTKLLGSECGILKQAIDKVADPLKRVLRWHVGVPSEKLCLGMLVFPAVWDWVFAWREARRGYLTAWEMALLLEPAQRVRGERRPTAPGARRPPLRPEAQICGCGAIDRPRPPAQRQVERFYAFTVPLAYLSVRQCAASGSRLRDYQRPPFPGSWCRLPLAGSFQGSFQFLALRGPTLIFQICTPRQFFLLRRNPKQRLFVLLKSRI
jgi:hypothetical protein